ncbi:hypothetical protein C8R45DRAFT_921737 [Mycena sanguinolenta]|nr:hypothetical protein C8R45DRAFT_921737 [Mycena sanguinolenta]
MYDLAPVMPAISPSLDLNLQNTYGALLIGCFLSVAVWGISLVQTYMSENEQVLTPSRVGARYEKDPPQLKLMYYKRITLSAIDTANEILVLRSVWPALILHWGRVDILGRSEGTVELIHHVWVASVVGDGSFRVFCWSWAFKHAVVSSGKQTQQLTAVAISLRAPGAATDILIAGVTIYILNQPRAQIPGTLLLNLNACKFISPVQTNIDLGEITWSENRTRTESGETIPQRLSTGPAYLSQAASGSATLQKLTLTLPEDHHVMKAGEARVPLVYIVAIWKHVSTDNKRGEGTFGSFESVGDSASVSYTARTDSGSSVTSPWNGAASSSGEVTSREGTGRADGGGSAGRESQLYRLQHRCPSLWVDNARVHGTVVGRGFVRKS